MAQVEITSEANRTQRICLNMIVKNESVNIERCLSALASHIDCWVICDTGSTDGTQEIIRKFFYNRNIPGELHSFNFENFEQARNEALDRVKSSALIYDYILLADADMELVVADVNFKNHLTAEVYQLIQKSGVTYWNSRLLRRDAQARYVGVTHEYLDLENGETRQLSSVLFVDHASGANRTGKFTRDAILLRRALETEQRTSLRARYIFYLANSLRDEGDLIGALQEYLRRAELGHWSEEIYVSLMNAGDIKATLDYPVDDVIATYEKASEINSVRAEALHNAARFCRNKSLYEQGYDLANRCRSLEVPESGLFISEWIYQYGILDELSIAAYWTGRYEECINICEKMLNENRAPVEIRDRIANNKRLSEESLSRRLVSFNVKKEKNSERKINVWHPQWSETLLLSDSPNRLRFEGRAFVGTYILEAEKLIVIWDEYPPETFLKNGDKFVYFQKYNPDKTSEWTNDTNGINILVIRSHYDYSEATQRVQSDPIIRGMNELGVKTTVVPNVELVSDYLIDNSPTHVLFHFWDSHAAEVAATVKRTTKARVFCLVSDIYGLDIYVSLSEFVDTFLAPTRRHKELIESATSCEVLYLPEGIDPIAFPHNGLEVKVSNSDKCCWFGYPESFQKSMKYIMPHISRSFKNKYDNFSIITKADTVLYPGIEHLAFDTKSFYEVTSRFGYAILSHFAFDLHMNSHIKSPNKMITAIVRGMIPIHSYSPSYNELSERFGMQEFAFTNGKDLAGIMKDLNYIRDMERTRLSQIREGVIEMYSDISIAKKLLEISK